MHPNPGWSLFHFAELFGTIVHAHLKQDHQHTTIANGFANSFMMHDASLTSAMCALLIARHKTDATASTRTGCYLDRIGQIVTPSWNLPLVKVLLVVTPFLAGRVGERC